MGKPRRTGVAGVGASAKKAFGLGLDGVYGSRTAVLAAAMVLSCSNGATGSQMTWSKVAAVTKSQTMFRRTKQAIADPRPYIEFKVTCEEDTSVSWILVAAAKNGIGVHNRTVEDSPKRYQLTGSCENHGRLYRRENGTDTDSTPPTDPATTAAAGNGSDVGVATTAGGDAVGDGAIDNMAEDDDLDDGFPCDEELTTAPFEGIDGSLTEAAKLTYCCDTRDTRTKWRGSNLLFAKEYEDRFIAGKTFNCQKGVAMDEGAFTQIMAIPYNGHYTLYIQSNINRTAPATPLVKLSGYVSFVNKSGQLAAAMYPLLVFYGVMSLFYLFLGIGWIVAMALHYQDLLRLQFWLCAVIFLGMIEMAFAFGNLDWINSHGTKSMFLFVLTQLLHAGKSTTARILVLVVSMGYGVVKPRLGAAFKQVVVFGVLYMAMASMYGITHIPTSEGLTESKYAMMAVVPLSVLDAGVLWWIFFSLHHTMKILALRQNTVKLMLYQRFRLLLAFFAIAAIFFFAWTLYNSWDTATNHAWENAWLLEAFQHILFSIVLIGILILWRPSMNNSRYAYATLETDLLDDEDYQVVPNFGHETMIARSKSSRGMKVPEPRTNVEDELAWVEENIPSSVLTNDNTLASLQMDSDEDIMETRILMNKME